MGLVRMTVRTKVVVSLINSGEVLLSEVYDPVKKKRMYVPVGGGVEFREYLIDAARREVKEELGISIDDLEFRSFTENIFEYDGKQAHEIVYHFVARIDDAMRDSLPVHGTEDNGQRFSIDWYSTKLLANIRESVVPQEIYDEIQAAL